MDGKLENTESGASFMGWLGSISALIGLFASLAGGAAWLVSHHRQKIEHGNTLALAQTQADQGQYQAAIATFGEILKTDPLDRTALDGQLAVAMRWLENFEVPEQDDKDPATLAALSLDQILPVLDAGLARTKGKPGADVQAHIGWAHWLNQRIAKREFGAAAEQNLRAALALDPSNVYANAMLANWMLQNMGSINEAIPHFNAAVASGNARPFVRALEFGGLLDLDQPGARAAIIKTADAMRRSGEPLDAGTKKHIVNFCFIPAGPDRGELKESISAAPPDDVWKTYLWLNGDPLDPSESLDRDFIHANLLEISGDREGALKGYSKLQRELKKQTGSRKNEVDSAIQRLSRK